MTLSIADFYSAPVVWVEDEVMRSILTSLWGATGIDVRIARGKEAVHKLVGAVPLKQQPLVYGVVDRDFDAFDAAWAETNRNVYVLPVHEAENLLLDFSLLAALSGRHGEAEVEAGRVRRSSDGSRQTTSSARRG